MTAASLISRIDRAAPGIRLGATPIEVRPDGYKVYRGVAAFGDVVLDYPESGRSEYAPTGEVMGPEQVATMIGVPFTIHHPDDLLDAADSEGVKEHSEGAVIRAVPNLEASPPELVVDVIVHTAEAQAAIESGKVCELSPGYRCEEDKAPAGAVGPGGKPYQVVQRRRKYNHLSGVIEARGVTPDGRRARLDEAGGGGLGVSPAESAGGSYALPSMLPEHTDEMPMQVNADAPPPTGDPAPMDAPPVDDPAAALAGLFSPEDAEVLKGLSPAGLAAVMALVTQNKAEMVEQAIVADPALADPLIMETAEGESAEEEAAEQAAEAASGQEAALVEEEDATMPAASQALTADAAAKMCGAMIADAMQALKADLAAMMGAKKADAAGSASPVDTAAIAERATAAVRLDAEFIAAVRKAGRRVDSVSAAQDAALATITEHVPALEPVARKALTDGRRDDFLAAFQAAEKVRRDSLIFEQEDSLTAIREAEIEYQAGRPNTLTMPARAVSGA